MCALFGDAWRANTIGQTTTWREEIGRLLWTPPQIRSSVGAQEPKRSMGTLQFNASSTILMEQFNASGSSDSEEEEENPRSRTQLPDLPGPSNGQTADSVPMHVSAGSQDHPKSTTPSAASPGLSGRQASDSQQEAPPRGCFITYRWARPTLLEGSYTLLTYDAATQQVHRMYVKRCCKRDAI